MGTVEVNRVDLDPPAAGVEAETVSVVEQEPAQDNTLPATPAVFDQLYLPLGVVPKPHHELIVKMLLARINQTRPLALVKQFGCRFYAKSPADFLADAEYSFDDKYLFEVMRERKGKSTVMYNRQLLECKGSWDSTGSKHAVTDSATSDIIGQRSSFHLKIGGDNNSITPSPYIMIEYTSELHPECDIALCVVYKQKKKVRVSKDLNQEREKARKDVKKAGQAAATSKLREKAAAKKAAKAKAQCEKDEKKLKEANQRYQNLWSEHAVAAATPVANSAAGGAGGDVLSETPAFEKGTHAGTEAEYEARNVLRAANDRERELDYNENVQPQVDRQDGSIPSFSLNGSPALVQLSKNVQSEVESDAALMGPSLISVSSPRAPKPRKLSVSRPSRLRDEDNEDDLRARNRLSNEKESKVLLYGGGRFRCGDPSYEHADWDSGD